MRYLQNTPLNTLENTYLKCFIRREQKETQTHEIKFGHTTIIIINKTMTFKEGSSSWGTKVLTRWECGQSLRTLNLTSSWTLGPAN